MAEIVTKNAVCAKCDTEVREGAAFCYHCGATVTDEPFTVASNNGDAESLAVYQSHSDVENAASEPENSADLVSEKKDEPELISAAKMRRSPKKFQRKRVEIRWEEPTGASSALFVIAAILLVLFAVGVWFLAGYLK